MTDGAAKVAAVAKMAEATKKTSGSGDDRLLLLEKEVKRLKSEAANHSVEQALQQVRNLADKVKVDNLVLLTAVEQLCDLAMLTGHPERDVYKHYLRACRELESSPGLRKLVISLMGDHTSKKVSSALDAIRKVTEDTHQVTVAGQSGSQMGQTPAPFGGYMPPWPAPHMYPPQWGPPGYGRGGPRGRPMGRRGSAARGRCYVCDKPGHYARDCQDKKQNGGQ